MEKEWKIKEKAEEDFFANYPEYDRVILQLLYNRNVKKEEEIRFFLEGGYENNFDPFLFKEMETAVDLTIKHIKEKNRICVFGDYDADGITASAVIFEILSIFKADCFVYIPDRSKEGYGLNNKAIETVIGEGAKLIITVDNGIRNKEEIEFAKSKGIDFILTDHHPAGDDKDNLPNCLIINPAINGETYPFKKLAGVGVAFKFTQALIKKSKLLEDQKIKLEEKFLDLVAIGSIADIVSLQGENRILVKKGLEILNKQKRIGIKELAKSSGLEGKNLEEWNIGFQIAPRLNASSRIGKTLKRNFGQAPASFNLLVEKDEKEAKNLAEKLSEKNSQRQKMTEEMVAEVEKQIQEQMDKKIFIGICPEDKCWEEGIVGLVAGRIAEKYYRPTLIITRKEDGFKGSGRSILEFNLAEAIDDIGELLGKHGGHPMACAFSFPIENLGKFIIKINNIASARLANIDLKPKLIIDCELGLSDINMELVKKIISLSPFGRGNEEPIFITKKAQIKDLMQMGQNGQHLKFRFNGIFGISFGKAEEWKNFKIGDYVDIVYNLNINKFNGREDMQLKIIDIKKSSYEK